MSWLPNTKYIKATNLCMAQQKVFFISCFRKSYYKVTNDHHLRFTVTKSRGTFWKVLAGELHWVYI